MYSLLNNQPGQGFRVGYFAVLFEHFMQLFFIKCLYDIGCGKRLSPVHTHIKRTIIPNRKTAFTFIKLVAAYAEVGEYTIHFGYLVQTKYPLQVTKVIGQKNDSGIIG